MSQEQKNKLFYRGICAILLLVCIIVASWLYTYASRKEAQTGQPLSSAATLANTENPSLSSNDGAKPASSVQDKLVVLTIGALAGVVLGSILGVLFMGGRAAYRKWYPASSSTSKKATATNSTSNDAGDSTNNNSKATNLKNSYDILTINTAEIDSNNKNAPLEALQKLKQSEGNKDLVIMLDTKGEDLDNLDPSISQNCTKLAADIQAYKQEKTCTVRAFFANNLTPKSYYIATAADEIYIKDTCTLTIPTVCIVYWCWKKPQIDSNSIKTTQATPDVLPDNNHQWTVYTHTTKILPKTNLEQKYTNQMKIRKNAITYNSDDKIEKAENLLKIAMDARRSHSYDTTFTSLGGITAEDALAFGLVDGIIESEKSTNVFYACCTLFLLGLLKVGRNLLAAQQ